MATSEIRGMEKRSIAWGAALLAIAVALGAFGAHELKERIEPAMLANWQTGVLYHFLHGLGILVVASLSPRLPSGTSRVITMLFAGGTILFSGSLYLLSIRYLISIDGIIHLIGPVTPLGGLLFMAGWIWLLITAWRMKG